jgi:hypothetical protein
MGNGRYGLLSCLSPWYHRSHIRPQVWDGFVHASLELGKLPRSFRDRWVAVITQQEEEAAGDALAPTHRIIAVPLPSSVNDRAPTIGNPELGGRLHEGMLKRGEVRHYRDDRIAQSLRKLARCPHCLSLFVFGLLCSVA